MNIEQNDLNIPPDEEPIAKRLSRLATQFFIPVLLPTSTAFVGWYAMIFILQIHNNTSSLTEFILGSGKFPIVKTNWRQLVSAVGFKSELFVNWIQRFVKH